MSFPRYEKYKDSGVEWLGDAPAHWKVVRLRHIAELNPSKSEASKLDRELPVSFLPMEAIGDDGTIQLEHTRPIGDVENGYTYFREGDVTLAKITPCFENGKGAVMRGLINGVGFGTTELIVVRPQPECTSSHYLQWLFMSSYFRRIGESTMYGAGGQKRLSEQFVRNFATAVPPLDEQHAIASFLDLETSKIDSLVAEQRRLVELLKEKRQAVISHAVTKGLDPTVPMKPSGIPWLGDIPAHWEVSRLKYATSFIVDCPHETPIYADEGEYLTIRTSDLDDGNLSSETMLRVDESEYQRRIRRERLMKDDIVYSREGGRWGHAALIPMNDSYCLGQRMMQFRVGRHFDCVFLMWHLNTKNVYRQGEVETAGAASPHVNVDTICNYRITHPPLNEQRVIADYIAQKVSEFEALIAEAERAITLLQERRTALISAAVTGKIDVRGIALEGAHP